MAQTTWTRLGWAGWLLTALVTLFLLADGAASLLAPPPLVKEMQDTGWPLWTAGPIGAAAVVSALLYAWPRTAVLGAVLVTGFLGGAISAHLRMGEVATPPELVSLAVGAAAWGGLWLRDARVRGLLPLA